MSLALSYGMAFLRDYSAANWSSATVVEIEESHNNGSEA